MFKLIQYRHKLAGAIVVLLLLVVCSAAQSQDLTVTPTAYDRYAASQVQNAYHRASPANSAAGRAATSAQLSNLPASSPGTSSASHLVTTRYPGDLQYNDGKILPTVQQHLIYVNLNSKNSSCSTIATCWGNPYAFLRDLGQSDFIHILDQYVGRQDDNRYTVSPNSIFVNYPTGGNPLTDVDMMTIVHAVVTSLRGAPAGYENLYHIFLMPGQDECFDSASTICYSPDNLSTFYFCNYHSDGDFSDIGHILYTVEPFQDVPYCSVKPGTPNGQLVDTTNESLAVGTFSTITDPDFDAWWINDDLAVTGVEISFECTFNAFFPNAIYLDTANVKLNGSPYAVNPEYDNSVHACVIAP